MSDLQATYRTLLEAASFAARAHEGQLRKDQKTPYVSHVFRVCLIVRTVFGFDDPRMLLAALLHDTVEDTTTDCDDLIERYGPEVAEWVALLTKDKRLPEKEREEAYCAGLASAPWQVRACKLADIFDNLMDVRNLPEERRGHSIERAAMYLKVLSRDPAEELKRPLELVEALQKEIKRS